MVRYTSDGIFEAPVDKVWTLLQMEHTPENITNVHNSIRSSKIIEEGEGFQVREQVVAGDAGEFQERVRMSFDPPNGFDMEWLDGPMKGSKCTHAYTPMGDQTKVVVDGDFVLEGADDKATEIAVDEYFTTAFNEDQAALKNLD